MNNPPSGLLPAHSIPVAVAGGPLRSKQPMFPMCLAGPASSWYHKACWGTGRPRVIRGTELLPLRAVLVPVCHGAAAAVQRLSAE